MDVVPEPSPAGFEREPRVWVREEGDEEYKLLPHAQWMSADVLNSPDLNRLLDGLDIETRDLTDDIEPLVLADPSVEPQNSNAPESFAWSDLLFGPNDAGSTLLLIDAETSSSDRPAVNNQSTGRSTTRRSSQLTSKPFKHFGRDALLPSGIPVERPPSPFDELYPFPPPTGIAGHNFSLTLSQSRQNRASRLLSKVTLMKRAGVNERHPGMLGLTNQLADVEYDAGNMTQANRLYQQVLASQRGDISTWSEKTLHAQAGLIDGLCREGHPLEAKEMLERVCVAMAKRFDPSHAIFRRLLKARIEIFNWMEDWDREEPVARDLVQICLVHLGSRDPETLNAMYRLASVKMGQGRYAESERLHRMTIQLCQAGTAKHHERMSWSSTGLGRVYEAQAQLDEATKILQQSSQRGKKSLGDENEAVMIGDYRLARILARNGRLQESEELLLSTLERQTKVLGEAHINPMCTMFELGFTLLQRKQYTESARWLEKCFRKSLNLSNFEFITRFCTRLGSCYEEQGRYAEALGFYYETMAFLQAAKERSSDELFDVEQYVAKVQDLIAEARRHVNEEEILYDEFIQMG